MKQFSITVQLLGVALGCYLLFQTIQFDSHWSDVWQYKQLFLKGWIVTIAISIGALFLSLMIGFISSLFEKSGIPLFVWLSKVSVELIRGTPLLVQILFFYYVIAHNIGLENRFITGVVILSIFHGAYISEMIRAGINAVSATQRESARAIGLTGYQSYRFVIIPQAIRQIIPPLAGQFASIIKDSSLLSVIGINELTNSAQQINSASYSTLEVYLPLGIAYLILTLPISLWSKKLEKKFQYET